jgi:prevent-host-death family protein
MATRKTPTLETATVSEARRTFSETLNRVYRGETRVMIEKNGIPVGVLVSPRDLSDIEEMQRRREDLRSALKKTRAAFDGVPIEEIDREVEKAIEEVEAQRRQIAQDRASA